MTTNESCNEETSAEELGLTDGEFERLITSIDEVMKEKKLGRYAV